jgi:hypothetical protein
LLAKTTELEKFKMESEHHKSRADLLQKDIDYSRGRVDKAHLENKSVTQEYVNETREKVRA